MTTGDIESHMREMHDIDISDSTISRITDKILPIVKEWRERPLEEVYAAAFMCNWIISIFSAFGTRNRKMTKLGKTVSCIYVCHPYFLSKSQKLPILHFIVSGASLC